MMFPHPLQKTHLFRKPTSAGDNGRTTIGRSAGPARRRRSNCRVGPRLSLYTINLSMRYNYFVSHSPTLFQPIFGPRILPAHLACQRRAWWRTRARSPSRHVHYAILFLSVSRAPPRPLPPPRIADKRCINMTKSKHKKLVVFNMSTSDWSVYST
jgi:hypothetical protein